MLLTRTAYYSFTKFYIYQIYITKMLFRSLEITLTSCRIILYRHISKLDLCNFKSLRSILFKLSKFNNVVICIF